MHDHTFATVAAVYDDGLTLIFDGESTATEKRFKCNTSVIFHAGDRVKLCADSGTYVVEYVVGAPAKEPDPVTVDKLVSESKSVALRGGTTLAYGDNASFQIALGTSSWPWYSLFTGAGDTRLCTSVGKLGFFGTTPSTRKTLSTTSVNQGYTAATASNYLTIINNIVGILKAHGLIST